MKNFSEFLKESQKKNVNEAYIDSQSEFYESQTLLNAINTALDKAIEASKDFHPSVVAQNAADFGNEIAKKLEVLFKLDGKCVTPGYKAYQKELSKYTKQLIKAFDAIDNALSNIQEDDVSCTITCANSRDADTIFEYLDDEFGMAVDGYMTRVDDVTIEISSIRASLVEDINFAIKGLKITNVEVN